MDPWNNVQWDRDVFAVPTAAEIATGNIVPVDLLQSPQTGLPDLTVKHLNCFSLGSYGTSLCDGYVTSIVETDLLESYMQNPQHYIDIPTHHHNASQRLQSFEAYRWYQAVAPIGYSEALYGRWEPLMVLTIPDINSRYHRQRMFI